MKTPPYLIVFLAITSMAVGFSAQSAEELRGLIIKTCSFSIMDKNIRPDLGQIDREMKQTIAFDADGYLICKKSLTYTPKNKHFSDISWNERVLLKDLNADFVSVARSDTDLNIHLHTIGERELVVDEGKSRKRSDLIVWTTGDKKTVRATATALSELIKQSSVPPSKPNK